MVIDSGPAAHVPPWAGLEPGLADVLRPIVPVAVDAAIVAIDRELPAFQGGLDGELGRTIRRGVEIALARFLDLLGTELPALDARSEQVYAGLGEGEAAQGRPMDTLLGAYRIGARVTWGHFAAAAVQAQVAVAGLVLLAEAIFAYIDEISAASAVGHARRQAADAGHRDVLRSRLAQALLEGAALTDPTRVRRLAADADWAIPAELTAAIVVPGGLGAPRPPTLPDALMLQTDTELIALLPGADPRGPSVRMAGDDGAVYLGSPQAPPAAAVSLAHARALRRLVAAGAVRAASIVRASDHLIDLVLGADPALQAMLVSAALVPLDAVPPARRPALEETLACWLAHQGDRSAVARELHVHPQTVSYRLRQLEHLLGSRLRTPAGRLSLTIALAGRPAGRAWQGLDGEPVGT